ncbi:MAG: D-sedoheptulose 7-phosphate isomerase [Deltaproteobacteria bacterium]|nr:D-sedoheptulose 7-phosphate isomerase [Deltaproteobacteria bacterium]MBW1961381.1 D-sedoheptulose 7-phosphate isomerase [Deltaproteobacteria bacterium]MBW2151073.1 D-sedoheptulose 7-phosphate isomerase [Deltaproteobacteria bacterium]
MRSIIFETLKESIDVKRRSIEPNVNHIIETSERIAASLSSGHKILIFGNGGSAADAQHIAAEFVNRFQTERSPLAAIALTTDSSVLTSIGNDYDFSYVFSKQIQALGKKDDVAWAISTSGNSKNVIEAVKVAREIGLLTIGMTGRGGRLAKSADLVLRVDSDVTARIQETHITLAHILCDLIERILFPEKFD